MQQLNKSRVRLAVSFTERSLDTPGALQETATNVESGENSSRSDAAAQLAQARRDLDDVIAALASLGMARCAQCRKFLSASSPGNFFGKTEPVCYACISEWWSAHSGEMETIRREKLETVLASWLRTYHGARIVKEEPGRTLEVASSEFRIVVHCNECGGSGTTLGDERCRFCNGFGTVWIVSPR